MKSFKVNLISLWLILSTPLLLSFANISIELCNWFQISSQRRLIVQYANFQAAASHCVIYSTTCVERMQTLKIGL